MIIPTKLFNLIMRATKKYVSTSDPRTALKCVKLYTKDGQVHACATDGFKVVHITNDAEYLGSGDFLIPWTKPVKADIEYIDITENDKEIKLLGPTPAITHEKKGSSYPDVLRFLSKSEPIHSCYFSAKLLRDSLDAFSGSIRIDFLGALKGIKITTYPTSDNPKIEALVLPVRVKENDQ